MVLIAVGCGGSPAGTDDAERDANGEIVAAGQVGTQALQVGDCFDEPGGGGVQVVAAVPCTSPHGAQMVGRVVAAETGDPWPGAEVLGAEASDRCVLSARLVLDDDLPPGVSLSAYVPDERSWEAGDRDIVCFVEGELVGDLTR